MAKGRLFIARDIQLQCGLFKSERSLETWDAQQGSAVIRALHGQRNTDKGDGQSISITEELSAKHKSLLDSAAGADRSLHEGAEPRDPLSCMSFVSKHLDSLKPLKTKRTRSGASPAGTRWTSFILPPSSIKLLGRGSRVGSPHTTVLLNLKVTECLLRKRG